MILRVLLDSFPLIFRNKGLALGSRAILPVAIAALLPLPLPLLAQDDDTDLSRDPHYRDELGVNQYTAPSIQHLFDLLDSLKPIPWQELERKPAANLPNDRSKYALSFGVLIGDGFLDVEKQDSSEIDLLGRELLRRAKGLGVSEGMTRHSEQLLSLARQNNWSGLRRELIITQQDVEQAMLALRDEQMAHLLSLGGWIRGLEIGAAAVAQNYTPERAAKMQQGELLNYYQDRLSTLSPRTKKQPLIQELTAGIKRISEALSHDKIPSKKEIETIRDQARLLVTAIES